MKQLWLLFVFVSLVLSVVPLIKRDWNEKYGIDWTGTYEDLHRCLDPSQMNARVENSDERMKQLWLLFVFVSLVLSVVPLIKRDWNEKYGIDWTGTYEDLHRCLDPSQMNETILEVLADEFERRMTPGNTFEGYDIVDAEFKVIRIRAVKSEYLKKSVTILPRIFRLQYDLQVISTEVGPHNATIHTNHDVTLIRTLGGYHITRHLKSKLETEVVSPQTLDGTFIQHNAFESPEIVDHAKETKQVNLMTYNIWNLNSPWNNRKDLIVQDVREINPDVIAWQEIRYHHKMREKNSIHQISDLMHNFPEHNFVFESGATYIDTYDARTYNQYEDEGVAISSRFPILESSYTRFLRNFSDHEDEHQRLCLRALVETPIGKINYFTSHFSLSENARLRNLVEFVEFSDRFSMPQGIFKLKSFKLKISS
eukprot:TRINITY_DN2426_c0_g1_i3.p1 TRINITY_DN2426_c0_g1~~TRINITY_DN2426_c0_g1_i3.p1  ORF type:complete len:440 (+),score=107.61 TRINITY_DN2426_c0_g1_i3:50-1321(+)